MHYQLRPDLRTRYVNDSPGIIFVKNTRLRFKAVVVHFNNSVFGLTDTNYTPQKYPTVKGQNMNKENQLTDYKPHFSKAWLEMITNYSSGN